MVLNVFFPRSFVRSFVQDVWRLEQPVVVEQMLAEHGASAMWIQAAEDENVRLLSAVNGLQEQLEDGQRREVEERTHSDSREIELHQSRSLLAEQR